MGGSKISKTVYGGGALFGTPEDFKKEKFLFFQNKEEIMLNVVIVTYDVTHIFFSLNLFASKFGNPNTGRAGLHSAF